MSNITVPTFDYLMNPLLRALRALGGSGSVQEIYDKVVEQEHFPDEMLAILRDPEKGAQTEVAYRLAWARTYLKKYGLLENSSRGIWSLNAASNSLEKVNQKEIVNAVKLLVKKSGIKQDSKKVEVPEEPAGEEWKQKLFQLLTQKLSAAAFERLAQRLLRESGFTQVEVTGRSGDGGIDGRGIARVHGLVSFHVLFQCKRHQGTIGPSDIRDFRGAMAGRTDKGLFITTGTFTPAAVKEATRDGAPTIDLIDGNDLADKLKELKIGIATTTVELVTIDEDWFETI
jgi:restriction system protein